MRHRSVFRRLEAWVAVLAVVGGGLFGPAAVAQVVNILPYQLSNGQPADASQVMANFNAIVAGVNANSAQAGVNSNITRLTGLISLQATGAISTTGVGTFGSITATGTASLGSVTSNGAGVFGSLLVNGAASLQAMNGTQLALSGALSTGLDADIGGNAVITGAVRTGGVTSGDGLYNAPGTVILPYGQGVRATNTVSARAELISTGINPGTSFNLLMSSNPSAGVYVFGFSAQVLQNAGYAVVASPAMGGSAPVFPVVTAKSASSFTLTYYNSSGTATAVTGAFGSDIIVSGGN